MQTPRDIGNMEAWMNMPLYDAALNAVSNWYRGGVMHASALRNVERLHVSRRVQSLADTALAKSAGASSKSNDVSRVAIALAPRPAGRNCGRQSMSAANAHGPVARIRRFRDYVLGCAQCIAGGNATARRTWTLRSNMLAGCVL